MFKSTRLVVLLSLLIAVPASTVAAPRAFAEDTTDTTGLRAAETVLSTTQVGRWAGASTTTFHRGEGQIHVFVRLENPTRTETQIRITIEGEGQNAAAVGTGVALDVPAHTRWRTFARMTTQRPAGRYSVVVKTSDGSELSRVPFDIIE